MTVTVRIMGLSCSNKKRKSEDQRSG